MKKRKMYWDLGVKAFSLQNAPSLVVVFEHASPEEYAKWGREQGITVPERMPEKPQDAFNAVFKKYMRETISRPAFEKKGFRPKRLSLRAKHLDALGFFEANLPEGFDMLRLANGLHFPDSREMLMDARTLLTFTDLKKITQRYP